MNNKDKLIIISCIILIILVIIYMIYSNFKQQTHVYLAKTNTEIKQVCFKQQNLPINKCFSVELAQTAVERERGLMFREKLDNDKGMLFVFQQPEKYGFWMKNMLIPLDIIWIDEDKTIVYIEKDVQPCKMNNSANCNVYYPNKEALYILEINSGLSEENNLSVGEQGDFIKK